MPIDEALEALSRSKFRSSFYLTKKDIDYIDKIGWDKLRSHCRDFIQKRLAPAVIPNDGKQTPWRGHPVFRAQHACACCCRGCLNKWYHIPKNIPLDLAEQEEICNLLMEWIKREYIKKSTH